jgi:8-oxo-dGTP diphosphatase
MPKSDQGIDQKRYQVVPRTLIFVFDQKIKCSYSKGHPQKRLWAGLFNGIGGHVERGEDVLRQQIESCLKRLALQD